MSQIFHKSPYKRMKWPGKFERKDNKGGIHKLHLQAMGRGLAKCQRYYIILCGKLINEGGKKSLKSCQRSL